LTKLLATVGPGVFGRRLEVRDRDEFQDGRELSLRREQLMIDLWSWVRGLRGLTVPRHGRLQAWTSMQHARRFRFRMLPTPHRGLGRAVYSFWRSGRFVGRRRASKHSTIRNLSLWGWTSSFLGPWALSKQLRSWRKPSALPLRRALGEATSHVQTALKLTSKSLLWG